MICQVQWCMCDGETNTTHSAPAIAYAIITVGGKIKKYPICAEHIGTLLKRMQHHDPNCNHPMQYPEAWSIEPLE